jgi:hypothetical protein
MARLRAKHIINNKYEGKILQTVKMLGFKSLILFDEV